MRPTGFAYSWRAPEKLVSVEDYHRAALRRLPPMIRHYVDGGADDLETVHGNTAAYGRWWFRPRALSGGASPKTATRVAGTELRAPILLAPTGFTGLSRWIGDPAAARAAERWGTRYTLSTASSYSIEEVFGATAEDHFFQLYPSTGAVSANLMDRAAATGCRTAFVTIDVPTKGNREGERKKGMGIPPVLTPARALSFALHPRWAYAALRHGRIGGRNLVEGSGVAAATESAEVQTREFMQATLSWDDVAWIRDRWQGALYLKGILHPEDAEKAARLGFDGIVVSNHGGRQLARALPTIDALPDIADAVSGRMEVLLDGGIRRGTDIVTALALGADAVMVGRPYLYGLAVGGEQGVGAVLDILEQELVRALVLLGVGSTAELGRAHVVRADRATDQAGTTRANAGGTA